MSGHNYWQTLVRVKEKQGCHTKTVKIITSGPLNTVSCFMITLQTQYWLRQTTTAVYTQNNRTYTYKNMTYWGTDMWFWAVNCTLYNGTENLERCPRNSRKTTAAYEAWGAEECEMHKKL